MAVGGRVQVTNVGWGSLITNCADHHSCTECRKSLDVICRTVEPPFCIVFVEPFIGSKQTYFTKYYEHGSKLNIFPSVYLYLLYNESLVFKNHVHYRNKVSCIFSVTTLTKSFFINNEWLVLRLIVHGCRCCILLAPPSPPPLPVDNLCIRQKKQIFTLG